MLFSNIVLGFLNLRFFNEIFVQLPRVRKVIPIREKPTSEAGNTISVG